MATDEKHPRLTPMRAVDLLSRVARAKQGDEFEKKSAIEATIEALEHHIKAALVTRRRKR